MCELLKEKKSLIGTFNITLIHYYRHYWIYGKRISDWLQFCPNVQRNKTRKYTPVPVIHFRFCIVPRSSSSVARSDILSFHLIIFSFSYLSFSCSYRTAYFVTNFVLLFSYYYRYLWLLCSEYLFLCHPIVWITNIINLLVNYKYSSNTYSYFI